jgi:nucleotide-binding universal stress UspA family protein
VIDAEARKVGADLIAMGIHGLSGLKRLIIGSTAERVLPHAPCPVLTTRRST